MKIRSKMFVISVCLAAVCSFAFMSCASGQQSGEGDSSTASEKVELQIYAANSLSKAMEEAQIAYTEENPNVTFKDTQFKGSGELNELLKAGGQADILISASKEKMEEAEEQGYADPQTRFNLFNNDLVIVTGSENDYIDQISLEDAASGTYTLAIGDDSVPSGNYANQALSTVGGFVDPDGLVGPESEGKANGTNAYEGTPLDGMVTLDSSVGNVCSHAEMGDVELAFVYSSDVYRFGGVKTVCTVPEETHRQIVYPAAVVAGSENAEAAAAFLSWCAEDPEAAQIWEQWGFEVAGA